MNFRPAATVSRIPQAVLAGSALSRSINFLEMVYSVLPISATDPGWDTNILVPSKRRKNIERSVGALQAQRRC